MRIAYSENLEESGTGIYSWPMAHYVVYKGGLTMCAVQVCGQDVQLGTRHSRAMSARFLQWKRCSDLHTQHWTAEKRASLHERQYSQTVWNPQTSIQKKKKREDNQRTNPGRQKTDSSDINLAVKSASSSIPSSKLTSTPTCINQGKKSTTGKIVKSQQRRTNTSQK